MFCRRALLLTTVLTVATAVHAQTYYYVDCSGGNPADFSTISAALAVAGPNAYILVTGTCTENVSITNFSNLNLGAAYGSTATIHGNVSITASNSVFLYGLNVTNPVGDAFDIASSRNVALWTCTGNGNAGVGLSANTLSDVAVLGPGSFDSNGGAGVNVSFQSVLNVLTWGGPLDISSNHGPGVSLGDGALFQTLGNTTIENNINVPGGVRPNGFGIQAVSASKVQVANCFGTTQISGNQSGGIDAREHSQVSIWGCGPLGQNIVQDNGLVGVEVGMGSQLALYTNVVISGHTSAGIDLYAEGQFYMNGPNLISQNGSGSNPRSAGVVVDGNSEAYLRGGTISNNEGPGILALVNSSVDSAGATFAGNTGGVITCDSSAYLISDLQSATGTRHPGIECRTPHHLGNGDRLAVAPVAPDFAAQKNRAAQYKKFASPKTNR
ncbi:MAG TPA: hypothetical protein VMG82_26345 [Candidatus Sulfotelmatobacter sp.]|nr:hypothetical protein [Candidatus Sulfotelmatobacter sp.]